MIARFFLLLGFILSIGAPATAAEEIPALTPREIAATANDRTIQLTLVVFSAAQYSLRVIDNAAPHDTGRFARLRFAMKTLGASAGCNGSFFNQHPFDPVGLMVADGASAPGPSTPRAGCRA